MMADQRGLSFKTPAMYPIRVEGRLDKSQFDRIVGAQIALEAESMPNGVLVTSFTCQFINQSALIRGAESTL